MDLYTDRPPTPAEEWAEETRNIEVPGMLDGGGRPAVVTIRRLPAAEVYLLQGTTDKGEMRDIFRRWAQAAVVAPQFNFNGNGAGVVWDSLPFAAHEGLASKIAAYSLQSSATAEAVEAAFRGGDAAGGGAGSASGGPSGAGSDGEQAAPAAGPDASTVGGA